MTDWSYIDPDSITEDDLEAKIIVSYAEKQEIQTKIFTSKTEFFPPSTPQEEERAEFNSERIRGKKVRGYTSTNIISLKIKAKKLPSKSSVLRSGGNYDFYDDDPTGFLLEVRFSQNEKNLRNEVMKVLQQNGFGCLWSDLSAHCHKAAEHPTDSQTKELLNKMCYSISNQLNGKMISDIRVKNKSKPSLEETQNVCEDGKCSLNRQGIVHEKHIEKNPMFYDEQSNQGIGKHVSINWQALFVFIPILGLYAYYRIHKLGRGLLVSLAVYFLTIFSVSFFSAIFAVIGLESDFGAIISYILGMSIHVHFIRKWSREWNENITSVRELARYA